MGERKGDDEQVGVAHRRVYHIRGLPFKDAESPRTWGGVKLVTKKSYFQPYQRGENKRG